MKAWMHPYAIEAEPCKAVPGALLYAQYNFLIRFIMKRISEASGGSTDTSRDHIYTDWRGLDGFVTGFIVQLYPPAVAGEAPHTAELVGAYSR
jgi:menaquinone-dependent protoporphyrinogen oxidase